MEKKETKKELRATATATELPTATIDFSAFEENDLTKSELHAKDKKLCKKILLAGSHNMIENFDSLKNSGVIPSEVTQEHLIYQFSRMITFFDNKGYKGIEAKHIKDAREKKLKAKK